MLRPTPILLLLIAAVAAGAAAFAAELVCGGSPHPLPALLKAWPTGNVRGVRARGGFEVDVAWANGRLGSG
jgi:hypothetical protein